MCGVGASFRLGQQQEVKTEGQIDRRTERRGGEKKKEIKKKKDVRETGRQARGLLIILEIL